MVSALRQTSRVGSSIRHFWSQLVGQLRRRHWGKPLKLSQEVVAEGMLGLKSFWRMW